MVFSKKVDLKLSSLVIFLSFTLLTSSLICEQSYANPYLKVISTSKGIRITDSNRGFFTPLPELRSFNLRAACYTPYKGKSLTGIIVDKHFRMRLRVQGGKGLTQKDKLSRKNLRRATNKAISHCHRIFSQKSAAEQKQNSHSSTEISSDQKGNAQNGGNGGRPRILHPAVAIPELAKWESQMLSFGQLHCQNLSSQSMGFDTHLAATYYDAQWVFYQIGDYTSNSYWYNCAQAAEKVYRDGYVIPNGGVIPGYWNFSHGVTRDYLSSNDNTSKNAAILLSQNASYAPDWTPLSWTADASMSREVAYAIMSYLNAENIGQPHRPRTEALIDQALAHFDQWFISKTAEYVRPFMFSLTAHALITYDSQIGGNSIILPAIITGANWVWDNCWLPSSRAFKYTDRSVSSGGTEPAPDLNLLIAPVYAWLWHQTGDPIHRDRADLIFAGGVDGAYLVNGKQFDQSYRWSFDYIKWRSLPPLR